MTAAELNAAARAAEVETARYQEVTNQAQTSDRVFDYMEPLPDLHIRKTRSWEPAARHYRDLDETERETIG